MTLASEKCVSLTTYRRSGEAVSTAVWIVPVSDGRYGFWTAMGSGKTKRIRNNPAITVQPCSYSGKVKPGTPVTSGTAELVQSGPLFDEVQASVRRKYGFQTVLTRAIGSVLMKRRGQVYGDTVVLLSLP